MKRLFFFAIFLIAQLVSFSQDVLPVPVPSRMVTDMAGLLSLKERTDLENKLAAFADSTTIQLVVVTIPSLEGAVLETYATKLFNTWGIGQKDKNNGLLILVAAEDRKVRIEVGRGLEEYVTNSEAKMIIDKNIVPDFKQGDYYAGIVKAVDVLCYKSWLSTAKGIAYKKNDSKEGWTDSPYFFGALALVVLFLARIFRWRFPPSWYGVDENGHYIFTNNSNSGSSGSGGGGFGGGSSGGGGASGSW